MDILLEIDGVMIGQEKAGVKAPASRKRPASRGRPASLPGLGLFDYPLPIQLPAEE